MRWYEQGSCFQVDWTKGKKRGKITQRAKGQQDEEAKKEAHRKLHVLAERLA